MPSETELAIAGFYDGIYLFYDKANSFLTFGLDRFWRAGAAAKAKKEAGTALKALDVCCGTGELCVALREAFGPTLSLTGADLNESMLSVARAKIPTAVFIRSEAKTLPFNDETFDLVALSFAARNLATDRKNLLTALREFRRVLKPGGLFLNLETTIPESSTLRVLMGLYVRFSVGVLSLFFPSGRRQYSFLKKTILEFYSARELSALLSEAGFSHASHSLFFPGSAALHAARK